MIPLHVVILMLLALAVAVFFSCWIASSLLKGLIGAHLDRRARERKKSHLWDRELDG